MGIYFFLVKIEYVLQVYFKLTFSILGMLTNALTILVVTNKNKKDSLKSVTYKHIYFNSLFNLGFCVVNAFSLVNTCILEEIAFCSAIYKSYASQYLNIYAAQFVGNTLRLCCNFSYISLSLSRFLTSTSNQKNRLFAWFKNVKLRKFYAVIFVISAAFSLFKVFEFKSNEVYSTADPNFPYNAYDIRYCGFVFKLSKKFMYTACILFPILNIVNNVLNNVLFLFLSIFIDVSMIRFTNKNLAHKKQINADLKHIKEAQMLKAKVNKMIIVNGLLYFVSHVPEFICTLALIVLKRELTDFCYFVYSCFKLLENMQTLNFLSISLQLFVFLYFDTNVKESFHNLIQRLFKKK